jgi:hypothetical protein
MRSSRSCAFTLPSRYTFPESGVQPLLLTLVQQQEKLLYPLAERFLFNGSAFVKEHLEYAASL